MESGGRSRTSPAQRWAGICRAVRRWALDHPHEWALVYGSPVPGYAAPEATIEPAGRIPRILIVLLLEAAADGSLNPPPARLPRLVTPEISALLEDMLPEGHDDLIERGVTVWTTLVGTISFELFGHLHGVVEDHDEWFDVAMDVAAEVVGLDVGEPSGATTR
jgi:hypothetical protein